MAKRPVFFPVVDDTIRLVREVEVEFAWNPGFAPIQKKKNIAALHASARGLGYEPLLEVSTKSEHPLGHWLSAFNLQVSMPELGNVPLECAFQSSKVFSGGGPFRDLLRASPRDARRDLRLRESGRLTAFNFENHEWPLEPKTAFYDWLFARALWDKMDRLHELDAFKGFTDIEFNPQKSINCQARSCALFVALRKAGRLAEAMAKQENFLSIVAPNSRLQGHSRDPIQGDLY